MAIPLWDCTYNGGALESYGLVFHYSNTWNASALGLSTFGFVVAASDIWFVIDNCEDVNWELIEPINSGNGSNLNWVSAYFTGYNLPILTPPMVDFTCMTHVMHFALLPVGDGTLDESQLSNGESSDSNPYSAELIYYAHLGGAKALITIGGEGENGHFASATSPTNIDTFIASIMEFFQRVRFYNGAQVSYDGIDIDWEEINPFFAFARFQNLISRLRTSLDGLGLTPTPLLTVAASTTLASSNIVTQLLPVVDKLDQINVLTYPYGGDFSVNHLNPGTGSPSITEQMLDFTAEIPSSKLGFGIDFDAAIFPGFLAPDPGNTDSDVEDSTYREVMATYYDGITGPTGTVDLGNYVWDSAANSAYLSISSTQVFANLNSGNIQFPSLLDLDWDIAFSVATWIKVTTNTANFTAPPSSLGGAFFSFNALANDPIDGAVAIGANSTNQIYGEYGSVSPATGWHHYALSYNGNGLLSGFVWYIDGAPQTLSNTVDNLASTPFVGSPFTASLLGGGWKNLGFYSSDLSQPQITAIVADGLDGDLEALSSGGLLTNYYPLNGNSIDQVGGIDGQDTNVTWGDTENFIPFQNETSIAQKIEYAGLQGFGVFCWELAGAYRADLPNDPDALMQAVKEDAGVTPGNITVWTVIPP